MLIKKITTGFVTQTFDTETGEWVDQQFICGDQCDYEDEDANPVSYKLFQGKDGKEAYLPYEMKKPEELS